MKKCINCNSKNYNLLFVVNDKKIVKCSKCGLVRTLSKPTTNYKKYHRDSDYNKHEELFRNIFQKRFNVIAKFKTGTKVLDIGASTGTMLDIFRKNNWEVWGVEPSSVGRIAEKKGIKIIKSTFEKAILPKNYFDVVIVNHVLEHVENPVIFLQKTKNILNKDGIIYVDVPNFESLISNLRGKRWKYLSPDEHLYHFTPKTLQNILLKSGFQIIYLKTNSGFFDLANPITRILYDIRNFRKNIFFDLAKLPLDIASQITNRGASLAVIAKKK